MAKQKMVFYRLAEAAQLPLLGNKVLSKVTAEHGVYEVHQASEHEDPCEKQMPLSPHCQPPGSWNGCPRRKGSRCLIGISEDSGRVERAAKDRGDALYFAVLHPHRTD